jgi:hypothetical protein
MAISASAGGGSAAAVARALAPHAVIEQNLERCTSAQQVCAELSRIFNVGLTEVALMRVEGDILNFLFPTELQAAGFVPLSSSKAVAARTASTRKVELFNNFMIVQHANVFETIKLSTLGQSNAPGANTIQKLMTAPVTDSHHNVVGVVQVCRKGLTPTDSGSDFTLNDLQNLEIASRAIGGLSFMHAV